MADGVAATAGYALVFSGPARLAHVLPRELPIAAFPFSLGRGVTADGCVHATPQLLGLGSQAVPIISRAHAVLEKTAAGLCVRDLGSVNGTWVLPASSIDIDDGGRATDGMCRRIRLSRTDGATEHPVTAGDQISIGNKLVRYTLVRTIPPTEGALVARTTEPHADTCPTVECPWALEGRSGCVCWVRHERVTMGRSDRADFIITGGDSFMQASRIHCALVYKKDQLYLEDLSSVNGTWINDERLQPQQPRPLQRGMQIVLGQSKTPELTFVVKLATEATEFAASGSPAHMLDDDESPEGVPQLAEETALPAMSRLFHSAQLRESQVQEEHDENPVPGGEGGLLTDSAVFTSTEPMQAATGQEPGMTTSPALEEPRQVLKRHRTETSPAVGVKVLRGQAGSPHRQGATLQPTRDAPPPAQANQGSAVLPSAVASENYVTTALGTSMLSWLVRNSKGSERQPDWQILRCIARLEATCSSLRHAVVIRGVWLSVLVARWGGTKAPTAEKLSRELVMVNTPAKSNCVWKERYAMALRWMPCPYTRHADGRCWMNHQTSQETQTNPWRQYADKRIVWKLPGDRSSDLLRVGFNAEHKDNCSELVRLSGVGAAHCVDGLVAGLPGGTEWIPPADELGSHVDLGVLSLPAYSAGLLPELTERLRKGAVPLTISWEVGNGRKSLVGDLSSSRTEHVSPFKVGVPSTAKRLRFPLQEPSDNDVDPCLCCGKATGPKLPGGHRCNSTRLKNEILLCDGCDGGFHLGCLPTPLEAVPPDEWYCPSCACGMKSRAGLRSLHALHGAKLVDIAGRAIMDPQQNLLIQIRVHLKPAAFHYAGTDGGYCVAVPKDKARTDKLFPALLLLLVECGNVQVGSQQDEYYRVDTHTPLLRPSILDANDFGVEALMESIRPPAVTPEVQDPVCLKFPLFPFQRKALGWMHLQEKRHHLPFREQKLHPLWDEFEITSATGNTTSLYVNQLTGTISRSKFLAPLAEPGGCLADEMGLGKTLMVLALIASHSRDFTLPDPSRSGQVMAERMSAAELPTPVKGTLIVVPRAILPQWVSETQKHTPSLVCSVFSDCPQVYPRGRATVEARDAWLKHADIVLVTYDEMQQEMKSARTACSALLCCQWWRVVLDEAQMVFNAAAQAAVLAGELWRVNGWCSTGTPMGNKTDDIHGLLCFLDHDPFADKQTLDKVLLKPYSQQNPRALLQMRGLMARFMWRRSKAHVEDEINLPPCFEKVSVVTLGQIERTLYNTLHAELKAQLRSIKRSTAGGQLSMTGAVRAKFEQLRKVCVHPQADSSTGHNAAPVPMLVLLQSKSREAVDSERQALAAFNGGYTHLESQRQELAKALADLEVLSHSHATQEEVLLSAIRQLDTAERVEKKRLEPAVSALFSEFGLPARLLEVFICSEVLEQRMGAAPAWQQLLELDGDEPELQALFGDASKSLQTAFNAVQKQHCAWRFRVWATARMKLATELAARAAQPWAVDQRAAAAQREFNAKLEGWRNGTLQGGTRLNRHQAKAMLNDVLAKAAAESPVRRDARMAGERAVAAWRKLGKVDRHCSTVMQRDLTTITEKIVSRVNSSPDVDMLELLSDSLLCDSCHAKINLEGFRREAMDAALNSSGAVVAVVMAQLFEARDDRVAATEHQAAAMKRSREAEQALRRGEATVAQEERRVSSRENELQTLRTTLDERRRTVSFLKNQIAEAEAEATRATAAAVRSAAVVGDTSTVPPEPGGSNSTATSTDGCGSVPRSRASDDDQDCCRICLEPYDDRIVTPCLHSFCGQCIIDFIRSSPAQKQLCPICRQPVAESKLQKVTAPVIAAQSDAQANSAKVTFLIAQIKQHIERTASAAAATADSMGATGAAARASGSAASTGRPFKCVVFSSWVRVLDIISDALSTASIGHANFTKRREAAVEIFSSDPCTHVLLVSMRGTSNSGAAGLTLTMASHAYLMEPMINFGLEAQAIGRINRIGQQVPPTIERIVVEDTIEQQILRLAQKKRSLQRSAARAEDEAVKNAEIEEIFGL